MKTILVPTDFSATADAAINYAVKLAKFYDASIILYHSFIPLNSGFYPPPQRTKYNLEAENSLLDQLSSIRKSIEETESQVQVSTHVDKGPEAVKLVEFCEKNQVDLIVMGTTGASGAREVLIGSFTADIMTKAPCPVLAVPDAYQFKIPEKITFAANYHAQDSMAINYLAEFNCPFNAKIEIVHAVDAEEQENQAEKAFESYKESMQIQCQSTPLDFQLIPTQDIAETILHRSKTTDLLAMIPVKREGFFERLINKSLTKSIAYHIRIPLLAIPNK
jgi:nucleotide-binding universal stress UspA family protein